MAKKGEFMEMVKEHCGKLFEIEAQCVERAIQTLISCNSKLADVTIIHTAGESGRRVHDTARNCGFRVYPKWNDEKIEVGFIIEAYTKEIKV